VKFHARILTDEEFAKITQPLKAEQPCLFCGKTYAEHADTDQGTRSYLGCRGWKGGFVKSNQPAAVPERDAEARLIDIEERANKATPGPWDYRIFNDGYSVEQQLDVQQIVLTCGLKNGADNSAFIAHARTDVPWLVSELRRVAAARKEGE
jgi:hypothetical protein